MASIAGMVVSLRAETAQFHKGLTKAQKKTKSFGRQLGESTRNAAKAFAFMAAGAGAALTALTIKSLNSGDQLAKTADKLGLTTQALAGLRHAAELTGVEQNKLDMGLQRMVRRVAEAAQGTGEARNALAELGLSAKELSRLSPDKQFQAIAERMNQVGSQGDKVRLAFKLFDAEGVDLVRTLNMGADGLRDMQREAETLGLAVNRVDAAKMEAANDAMTRAQGVFKGLFNRIAAKVAPIIEGIAKSFTNAALKSNGFASTVDKGFNFVVKAAGFVADTLRGISTVWALLKAGAIGFATVGLKAFEGLRLMGVDLLNIVLKPISWVYQKITEVIGGVVVVAGKLGLVSDDAVAKAVSMAESVKASIAAASTIDRGAGSVQTWIDTLEAAGTEAAAKAHEKLMAPMPSEVIEGFVAQWQEAGQRAGEAVAAAAKGNPEEVAPPSFDFALANKQAQYEAEVAQNSELFASLWLPNLQSQQQIEANLKRIHLSNVTAQEKQYLQMQVKQAQEAEQRKQATIKDGWNKLVALQGSGSKKMFKIGKAAGIADALISTYKGVAKAMELPWPMNMAVAASNLAFGMMQVQKIRSQQFGGSGGGGGGSSAPAASSVAASVPSQLSAVPAANDAVTDGAKAPETRVQVVINGNVSGNDARKLVDEMVEIINQDDVVLISPTSRNGQELAAAAGA